MRFDLVWLAIPWVLATATAATAQPQAALLALTRDGHFIQIDSAGVETPGPSIGLSNVLALERGADGVYYAIAEWNRLYAVDPASGRSSLIVTLPGTFAADLANDSRNRRLYAALDTDGAGEAETLFAIDPVLGTVARIGPFEDPANPFDFPRQAFGLAFTPESRLLGTLFAVSPGDAILAPIDPATGLPGAGERAPGILSGLDFGPDGGLYALDQAIGATSASLVVSIDPATGAMERLSNEPLGLELAPGDCANGVDDDADGTQDGDDPGCQVWALDAGAQTPDCVDGEDDDGDGLVDLDDPGCSSAADVSERAIGLPCDDGLDNDLDGSVDATGSAGAPSDLNCGRNPLGRETASRCGLGAEVAIVLPFARLLLRRGRDEKEMSSVSRARARADRRP